MKYPIDYEGPNGWTEWERPKLKGYKWRCCGCETVHNIEHRIVDGHIEWRVQVNRRSTAAIRRWMGVRRGSR